MGLGASQNCEARNALFIASRRLSCRRNPRDRSPDRDRCVHPHRVDLRAFRELTLKFRSAGRADYYGVGIDSGREIGEA